jgi:hypothetical protein
VKAQGHPGSERKESAWGFRALAIVTLACVSGHHTARGKRSENYH